MAEYNGKKGVWRTVGGRRIFIVEGEDLATAMKKSGKFSSTKGLTKEGKRIAKGNFKDEDEKKAWEDAGKFVDDLINKEDEEYKLYKQAVEHPETIGPMTENSTDWEALEKKYKDRYEKDKNESWVDKMSDREKRKEITDRLDAETREKVNEYWDKEDRSKEIPERETRKLKSQKSLKNLADDGRAKDITTLSDAETKKLRERHGHLEVVQVTHGTYGMNGALLRSSETGEYFVITSRNSNLFYWV